MDFWPASATSDLPITQTLPGGSAAAINTPAASHILRNLGRVPVKIAAAYDVMVAEYDAPAPEKKTDILWDKERRGREIERASAFHTG